MLTTTVKALLPFYVRMRVLIHIHGYGLALASLYITEIRYLVIL